MEAPVIEGKVIVGKVSSVPLGLNDGIVIDGIVIDGFVIDGIVIDGIVIDGIVIDRRVGTGGPESNEVQSRLAQQPCIPSKSTQ